MTQSSDSWNPIRFINTLNYFGEIPFVGNIQWLQQMFGAPSNPHAPASSDLQPSQTVILLSEGGTKADDLVNSLKAHGIQVRSQLLTSHSDTSSDGANRIVNAAGIVWQGVPDDEECLLAQVEDLPNLPVSTAAELFDFQKATAEQLSNVWGAVDDVVMGGASASGLFLLPGFGRFSGTISTANSGGFASVRTRNFAPPFDLQGWQGIRLILRGDGQRYKVILRNSSNWDSLAYCVSIDTEVNQWMVIDIPFSALRATFRAKTQPTAPAFDPSTVCSFQLMLSKFEYDGDKNPHFHPGAFSLDVRSLAVYRPAKMPLFVALAATHEQRATYEAHLKDSGLAYQVLSQADADLTERLTQALRTKIA